MNRLPLWDRLRWEATCLYRHLRSKGSSRKDARTVARTVLRAARRKLRRDPFCVGDDVRGWFYGVIQEQSRLHLGDA